jgi:hypothetical protein
MTAYEACPTGHEHTLFPYITRAHFQPRVLPAIADTKLK